MSLTKSGRLRGTREFRFLPAEMLPFLYTWLFVFAFVLGPLGFLDTLRLLWLTRRHCRCTDCRESRRGPF